MITKKSLYRCVALAVLSMAAASQAQALTRQEFAKAADAICVKAATAGQARPRRSR